jgi:hypothetical protein
MPDIFCFLAGAILVEEKAKSEPLMCYCCVLLLLLRTTAAAYCCCVRTIIPEMSKQLI